MTRYARSRFVPLLLGACFAGGLAGPWSMGSIAVADETFKERLLTVLPAGKAVVQQLKFEPLGRGVAAEIWRDQGSRRHISFNGEAGPEFENLLNQDVLRFSPDGERIAYVARDREGRSFVFDGKQAREYGLVTSQLAFSPEGRLAYVAGEMVGGQRQLRVYLDGNVASDDAPQISGPHWIGKEKLAFVLGVGFRDRRLYIDGRLVARDLDSDPVFSLSGSMAFVRADRDSRMVFVDGRKGPEYEQIGSLTFGADGKTVAYAGRKGKRWDVVIGGRRALSVPSYVRHVFLGRDRKTFAFEFTEPEPGGEAGTKQRVQVGSRPGRVFNSLVHEPVFSPDGKALAYVCRIGERHVVVTATRTTTRESESYSYVFDPPIFSPDGKTVAYAAQSGGKGFVVIGEERGPEFRSVRQPVFSPDGKTVAYLADGDVAVIGEKRYQKAQTRPIFSRNGKKAAYGARIGSELWWKVVDVD